MQKKVIIYLIALLFLCVTIILIPVVFFNVKFSANLPLPSPDINGEQTLENALLVINQTPTFLPHKKITLETMGQLLWSMQGITHGQKRTAPSAGATYPLELYLYPYQVESTAVGLYHYLPEGHYLQRIHQKNISKSFLETALLSDASETFEEVQAFIFISIIPERTTFKYGERGNRYIDLEIGHVLANVYLQSVSTNIHINPIIDFNSTEIQKTFMIEEEIVVIIPVAKCESYNMLSLTDSLENDLFGNQSTTNELTVEQAIYLRQSIRNYQQENISVNTLNRLMWFSYINKTNWLIDASNPLSFSSFSAFSNYLFTSEYVPELEPGIYHINKQSLNLSKMRTGNFLTELYEAGISQNWIKEAAFNFVPLYNSSLLNQLTNINPIRKALFDIGIISQFFYLESRNLDLGMVTVGAFIDGEVTSILDDILLNPIYIIPNGYSPLTNINQKLLSIDNATFSKIFGIITLTFFYLSCFMAIKPLKKKLENHRLTLHHVFSAGFSIIFLLGHFLLIDDLFTMYQRSEFLSGFLEISKKLIGYNLHPFSSFYNFGLLASLIAFWLIILLNITSFILLKIEKVSERTRKIAHQILVIMILFCIFIHTYANCLITSFQYWLFFAINLSIILLYIGLHYYQEIFSIVKNKNDIVRTSKSCLKILED
ncbi:MAG: SagB family peptide dehydrogenase [Asgard group archaeon]|nr:SagB family peptide dehydrogenase [Asgard group archaeon]